MRIPASAAPDVQETIRQLWAEIDRLRAAASLNLDVKGKRIINAGAGVAPTDYVTKQQLDAATQGPASPDGDFRSLLVRGVARFLGLVYVGTLDDGGIVFAKASGELATDVDNFSWRFTNNSLRLGAAVAVRWHHLAELRSPATGVLELSGEDHDVSNQFVRLVLGLDDATGIALRRNGVTLELRVGGAGGALTDLVIDDLTADVVGANTVNATTVNATTLNGTVAPGSNGAFATVVVGTDPGGGDPLRVGGGATFNGDTNAHRVDGTSFRVNAHAGVDFGPGPIASITIEKGIVTAAS